MLRRGKSGKGFVVGKRGQIRVRVGKRDREWLRVGIRG